MDTQFAVELKSLIVQLMSLDDMKIAASQVPRKLGTQQFESWIVQVTTVTFTG